LSDVDDITGTVLAAVMPRTVVMTAVPASTPNIFGTTPMPNPARRLAAQAVAALLGCAVVDVVIRSLCRHCGGAHGSLFVDQPANSGVTVSLSRAPGLEIAVASHLGPIGIDVESVGRMLRAPVDSVALHPLEIDALAQLDPGARDRARTVQWTRKEALLKATGFGLRIAPDSIALSGLGEAALPARVVSGSEKVSGTEKIGIIEILEAPDLLWDELTEGGFVPEFTDLGDWAPEHPESASNPAVSHPDTSNSAELQVGADVVGSLCVLHTRSARGAVL
jgi:4'-phosphopantetheinyl transferase